MPYKAEIGVQGGNGMKRGVCWVFWGFMVAALVAAIPGCFGGGTSPLSPDEIARHEVNAFLDRLAAAFKAENTDAVIGSCSTMLAVESDEQQSTHYPADCREFVQSVFDMIDVLDCRFDNRQIAVVSSGRAVVVFDFFVRAKSQGTGVKVTGRGQFDLFSPAGSWEITRAKQFYSTVEQYLGTTLPRSCRVRYAVKLESATAATS